MRNKLTKSLELLLLPWATAMSPSGILITYTWRFVLRFESVKPRPAEGRKQQPISYPFLDG